ncbi:MAG: DUF433 domain-containing protein [Pleurocapsa sp. SU_196_0]|nr:DUF433 domain-containing protein [Pleurocapsa sp. SU_196_0]
MLNSRHDCFQPEHHAGKPVIQGTRVTVEAILEKFAMGLTQEQILEAYPHLKAEDIAETLIVKQVV